MQGRLTLLSEVVAIAKRYDGNRRGSFEKPPRPRKTSIIPLSQSLHARYPAVSSIAGAAHHSLDVSLSLGAQRIVEFLRAAKIAVLLQCLTPLRSSGGRIATVGMTMLLAALSIEESLRGPLGVGPTNQLAWPHHKREIATAARLILDS